MTFANTLSRVTAALVITVLLNGALIAAFQNVAASAGVHGRDGVRVAERAASGPAAPRGA